MLTETIPPSLAERVACELPGFAGAAVACVRPLHGPGDDAIRFYEIKFSRPDEPDAGYAIVAATTESLPVLEFNEEGQTPSELLAAKTGRVDLHVRYLGGFCIAAEDDDGELVDVLGEVPRGETSPPTERGESRREAGANPSSGVPRATRRDAADLPAPVAAPKDEATRADLYRTFRRRPVGDVLRARAERAWQVRTARGGPRSACVWQTRSCDPAGLTSFTQIPKKTGPNHTLHWSGCGPTAWMNLLGWFNLHRAPELFGAPFTVNNAFIETLTMKMHDHLGTIYMVGQGYTAPWDMVRGATFARDNLHHDCSSWCREDWWYTDETWVYEVARAMIGEHKPFIVGYYSDKHYTICSRTKECEAHGWGDNDHCFLWLPELQKWIPKETIFAVYGIDEFWSLRWISEVVSAQELVAELPGTHGRMHIHTGIAIVPTGVKGRSAQWTKDHLLLEVGKEYLPGQVADVNVTVGLASIANAGPANSAGWAVDRCKGAWNPDTGRIRVEIDYALRDSDGYLHRIAYSVAVRSSA